MLLLLLLCIYSMVCLGSCICICIFIVFDHLLCLYCVSDIGLHQLGSAFWEYSNRCIIAICSVCNMLHINILYVPCLFHIYSRFRLLRQLASESHLCIMLFFGNNTFRVIQRIHWFLSCCGLEYVKQHIVNRLLIWEMHSKRNKNVVLAHIDF